MKKFASTIVALFVVLLAGCASEKPLTEEEQAAKYGMTVERYREEKTAAARMGMTWEEHIKTIQNEESMDMGDMKMGDNMKMK